MADENDLPPVEDLPVLNDATDTMDMSIAVGGSGRIYIFHEKPFAEPLIGVEYNTESGLFVFISEEGRLQPIGLTIPPQLAESIEQQNFITLTYLVDKIEKDVIELPLVTQKYQ